MSARKRMRLEGGSSSSDRKLLEPSATINDLPSEVMKNIFSYVGKGNYCFVGPVSKDFCFNYLTMDVIEDKFVHKMDCQLAIGKNKVTTPEAASASFELAEHCFLKAPEDFQKRVVKSAIRKGRVDIVEMGFAMGVDIKLFEVRFDVEKIVKEGDLEMLKLVLQKCTYYYGLEYFIIATAAKNDQLRVLKFLKESVLIEDRYYKSSLFIGAARRGNLGMIKWVRGIADSNYPQAYDLINAAAGSGNIELVKYLRSEDISWNESAFCSAVYSGNIPMLQYLLENDCPHDDPDICSDAVEMNDNEKALKVLKWLRNKGVPWDENTCIALARKGNLKGLKFARSNGCSWDENCLTHAIETYQYEIVKYCLENGCPIGNSDICSIAMEDQNQDHDRALKMLKLLREFAVPWSDATCTSAASFGNFDALKWAVLEGCPWDRQECANHAAGHGNIEILNWIKDQGILLTEMAAKKAALNGHIETLKWLKSENCPMGRGTFLRANISGKVAVVEFCIENGFPFEEDDYEGIIKNFQDPIHLIKLLQKHEYPLYPSACQAAASKGDLQLLRWLRLNKFPWDENTCNEAVTMDRYEVLKYAHKNGCPWTKETYAYCFSEDGLDEMYDEIPTDYICSEEIFEYLNKHNCPQPDPDDWINIE